MLKVESLTDSYELAEPEIGFKTTEYHPEGYWSYGDLFSLFFELVAFGNNGVHVVRKDIFGFGKHPLSPFYVFRQYRPAGSLETDIRVVYEPDLVITTPSGSVYQSQQVFVHLDDLNSIPVRITRLKQDVKSKVFADFFRHKLRARCFTTPKYSEPSILIELGERKPCLDYAKTFSELTEGGRVDMLVDFLNQLDMDDLPLLHDQSWQQNAEQPVFELEKLMTKTGEMAGHEFYDFSIISQLKHDDLLQTFKNGLIDGLLDSFYNIHKVKHPENSTKISSFLESSCLGYDEHFESWIKSFSCHLSSTPKPSDEHISDLKPYVEAITPLVKSHLSRPRDLLKETAPQLANIIITVAKDSVLYSHFRELETNISEILGDNHRWTKFDELLAFFIHYPLQQDAKIAFLDEVKEKRSHDLRVWDETSTISQYALDQSVIALMKYYYDYRDFKILDIKLTEEFLSHMSCRCLLAELSNMDSSVNAEQNEPELRWSIINKNHVNWLPELKKLFP